MALAQEELFDISILESCIYRHGGQVGFILKKAEYIDAFEEPQEYIQKNPTKPLAYCVAAFYLRERLRDIVNELPARHIVRDGDDVHFIVEPETRTH